MTQKNKRILFPVGIFLLLFFTEILLGTLALAAYSYISLKTNIAQIEEYTRNYSATMAEAFAGVAEFSFRTKKYYSLKILFHEKIRENTIDEAFFVLSDGRLIAHSNTTIEKELGGNMANDEMSYNMELILEPVTKKSSQLYFSDYNIIKERIPFNRTQKELLKKYIYPDINTTGWLFTKAVFVKGKPAGSVCFIISKKRIFDSIIDTGRRALFYWYIIAVASCIVSLAISLIVLFRYRSLQKRATQAARAFPAAGSKDKAGKKNAVSATPRPNEKTSDSAAVPDENSFEPFIIEPVDDPVIEKDYEIPVTVEPLSEEEQFQADSTGTDIKEDDGYITVEFLGDIQDEPAEHETQEGSYSEYVAKAIPAGALARLSTKEIRDAIPANRKR